MAKKKLTFSRGYKECRDRIDSNSYYTRSCFNCEYFYKEYGDIEEVCQNEKVLEYDMIVTENNVCCLKWSPSHKNSDTSQGLFRHGRR